MKKVVIDSSEILSAAWEQAKKNGLALAVIFFVISIIQSAISGSGYDYSAILTAMKENDALALQNLMGGNSAMSYLAWVVYAVLMIGFNRMILLIVTGVKSAPSFDAYKMDIATWAKIIAVEFIVGIICACGFCLCILPGIYLLARLEWASYYLMENNEAGIGEALSASWNMSGDNAFELILVGLIAFFVAIAGLLLCCVGVYYTTVVAAYMQAITYLKLKANLE
ncbi:MAG: hypothetical protein J5663_08115 [Bacteroidaceae bacterium]|nr:hypothetical protein [Bacteroidaceae bacterium]